MSEHQITVREEQAVAKPADLLSVIDRIVQSGLTTESVAALDKLLAMQERVIADQRKTAYMAAMARLQEKLPQINKHGQAKNSRFAKLEDMDVVIRPILAEEGFSFSFDEEAHAEKTVTFVATLSHREGHAESKRLTVPIDAAAKNRDGQSIRPAIQDAGSTVSYARRYLIKMMLNIIERDEDTNGENMDLLTPDQAKDLEALADEVKANKTKFLEYMGAPSFDTILERDLRKAITALETKRKAR